MGTLRCKRPARALALAAAVLAIGAAEARAATDVVLVFDTSGSMDEALDEAKDDIRGVIATINDRYDDVRYAVATVQDYPDLYGDPGDRPWDLVQPLSSDADAIDSAISSLVADGGGDDAESYGRALFEADRDPAVGFRPGAQRLAVLVADNVPHDDDLNIGIPEDDWYESSPFDTEVDPGRDETVGTADDIDWQPLLSSLKDRGMPLFFVLFKGTSSFLPYWRAWAGATGGSASTSEEGTLGETLVTSISAGAANCPRSYTRLVTVDVCADTLTRNEDTGVVTATGDVRVNDGVALGAGPLTVHPGDAQIRGRATVEVVRGSTRLPLGTGLIAIDARAVDDPVSGRKGMAPVTFPIALSPFGLGSIGLTPGTAAYLDPADGGGIVFTARPLLDLFGVRPNGELALGAHANAGYRVLGGKASYSGLKVFNGEVTGSLAYEGASNAWKLEGEAKLPNLFGAGASATIIDRRIDAVSVKAKTPGTPLGTTGIILDTFAGAISGLTKRTKTLKLSTSGGYGPKLPAPIDRFLLRLEEASVSLATDLSGELASTVSIVDRRLAGGDMKLKVGLRPAFRASGTLNLDVSLLGTGWAGGYGMAMDARHFTGSGRVQFRVAGQTVQGAGALVSDAGVGATARLCVIGCKDVGAGIRWRDVASFPPNPEWIGADIERFRTIARRQSGVTLTGGTFRVRGGDALVALSGTGAVQLVGPDGVVRTLDSPGANANAERAPDGRWALNVAAPAGGDWKVASTGSLRAAHVPSLGTVRPRRVRPRTSRRSRLGRRRLVVRWRPRSLPRGTRVKVLRSGTARVLGTAPARRRRLVIPRKRLRRGRTRVALVVTTRRGIPFRRVRVPGTVWR